MPLASLPPQQSPPARGGPAAGRHRGDHRDRRDSTVDAASALRPRRLAENADKLERYRRLAGTRPQVGEAARGDACEGYAALLPAASGAASLSAATSSEVLRALIEQQAEGSLPLGAPVSKDEGRHRLVTVNVQLIANIFALRKIFYALETSTPYLFIDNLTVRTQVAPGHRLARARSPRCS